MGTLHNVPAKAKMSGSKNRSNTSLPRRRLWPECPRHNVHQYADLRDWTNRINTCLSFIAHNLSDLPYGLTRSH